MLADIKLQQTNNLQHQLVFCNNDKKYRSELHEITVKTLTIIQ
jgi:hypothetical protein